MSHECVDHLNFCGEICPDCLCSVDAYGNTADQFDYCSYPDCGCDGNRLCGASSGASERAATFNVEGMYRSRDGRARLAAYGDIISPAKEQPHD